LTSKFAKSANTVTEKIIFQIILIWVSKNPEFDAEFESVEKKQKSLHEESYRAENFCTEYLNVKKYIIPTLSC
jgi:hypothetical protein